MSKENNLQLIKSGNPLADLTWGGFYKGGTYFEIGPQKSGKTILALQFAINASSKKDSCLYLTTFKLNDLMINSSVIDLELQGYIDKGIITLTKIDDPKMFTQTADFNSNLRDYFGDLKKLIELYSPTRIVVDEFTPLMKSDNLKFVSELIIETQEYLRERGITGLFIVSENEDSEISEVQSAVSKLSTACIYLYKQSNSVDRSGPGIMKIIPNFIHPEAKLSSKYYIEIHKGVKIVRK